MKNLKCLLVWVVQILRAPATVSPPPPHMSESLDEDTGRDSMTFAEVPCFLERLLSKRRTLPGKKDGSAANNCGYVLTVWAALGPLVGFQFSFDELRQYVSLLNALRFVDRSAVLCGWLSKLRHLTLRAPKKGPQF